MCKFIDLTGLKFNRLTPIKYMGKDKNGKSIWLCRCLCGKKIITKANSLKTGNTRSCGCLQIEKIKLSNTKHGYSLNNKERSRIYRIWGDIIQRCTNSNNIGYKNYGGRTPTITVCDRWNISNGGSFENFFDDMGEPPSNKHQIDRTNNDLGYFKENCRWVLSKENNRNKRTSDLITFNNETHCLSEWAEIIGIKRRTLWARIYKYNWFIEKALTTSIKKGKK